MLAAISLNNGIELADLQSLLGHNNPAITLRYAKVSEERKQNAQKKFLHWTFRLDISYKLRIESSSFFLAQQYTYYRPFPTGFSHYIPIVITPTAINLTHEIIGLIFHVS